MDQKQVPQNALAVMKRLEEAGYEAYLVGGCVRDLLLGRVPHDFDITTNALPDEVEALFNGTDGTAGVGGDGTDPDGRWHTVPVGKEHGTVGVITRNEAGRPEVYEVTTYRIDGTYSDNRHPDQVTFTRDLEADLMRRDFTVNALAMDRFGKVRDLVGGLEDLESRTLRAVGDPYARFDEDALRILRGIRFAAQLSGTDGGTGGFVIEPATAAAIRERKHLLHNIAAERIRAELDKVLMAPGGVRVLRAYREVFAEFIPELAQGFGFDQQNPYHCYDVYEHTLHAVDAVPRTVLLPKPAAAAGGGDPEAGSDGYDSANDSAYLTVRLAALLHDVGKPACFVVRDGWGHFYGHEHTSADMARDVLNRLKYDNKTRGDVVVLIKAHGAVFQADERYARRKLNQLGEERLRMLIALERADVSAQAEAVRAERIDAIDRFAGIVGKVLAEDQCFSVRDLAVDGHDLIALGIPAGPAIGNALSVLLENVIDGKIENDRKTLLAFASGFLNK